MAYTDDAVLSKLSALNETQESIVTVAQWVMFHRRHADRTGQLWLQRLKDSGSNKRLNLIYLANEVAQQSKARRKDDFLLAFSPVIAEATALAYKGATNEVQQKLRRVVEVWRQRQIFEIPVQEAIEARIEELDKSRSGGKRGLAGGSIFSSNPASVPSELQPLIEPQQQLTKFVLSTKTSVNAADHDYDKLTNPSAIAPSPPVHAARLNGLLKTLANAEGAVAESIKARKVLIEGLEKILDTNRHALLAEESLLLKTQNRWTEIDIKKKDVEDSIMRGFASNSNPGTPAQPGENSPGIDRSLLAPVAEPGRPEVEALTPPGYPLAPPPSEPIPELELASENGNGTIAPPVQSIIIPSEGRQTTSDPYPLGGPNYSFTRPASAANASSVKKRKLNNDDFLDLGDDDGLDADVADILRRDSGQGL